MAKMPWLDIRYLSNLRTKINRRGEDMLALTRKKNESIIIGDNIEIKILDITGDKVRIGIEAPMDISIHRYEIYLQIQEENKEAATNTLEGLTKLKSLTK